MTNLRDELSRRLRREERRARQRLLVRLAGWVLCLTTLIAAWSLSR